MAAPCSAAQDIAGDGHDLADLFEVQRAVISDPDFSDASMTTTASDGPLMRRFRIGNGAEAALFRWILAENDPGLRDLRRKRGVFGRVNATT